MELYKRAAAVAGINFRRWIRDSRVRLIFIFIGCLIIYYMKPYTEYGLSAGRNCSGWLLPILFSSSTVSIDSSKMYIYLGMLLLLCDAPFFSPSTPSIILRSRRDAWWVGECLYIMLASLVYTLFVSIMCMISVLPVAAFGNEWGGVMQDLIFGSQTRTAGELMAEWGLQYAPRDVIRYLYPQGAELYTFLTAWGSFSFLGLLMYLGSLYFGHVLFGMCFSGLFIFLNPVLVFMAGDCKGWDYWLEALSPVCWTSIERLHITDQNFFIRIPFVAVMYPVLIGLLCFLICRCSRAYSFVGGANYD